MLKQQRFEAWCGQGLPKAWAENMGVDVADIVWPIVDTEISGPINGYPAPEQMLCWCPSPQKQALVLELLKSATGDVDAWKSLRSDHDPTRPGCAISRILSNLVSSELKLVDAPCSSAMHLDTAISELAKLTTWRPQDTEGLAIVNDAIEYMSHYGK